MISITDNIDLASLNSFGIAAKAERLICFDDAADLVSVFDGSNVRGRWEVLGGGNNILFTGDFAGTLIHPLSRGIYITEDTPTHAVVHVEAGAEWDDVVAWSVEQNLWGIENLSSIPGYAGAAPVQNIGAYGVEFKDVAHSVEMFCVDTRNFLTLSAAHCAFGYRDSIFKNNLKGKVIITAVNLILKKEPGPNLEYGALRNAVEALGGAMLGNIREAVVSTRRSKLPDTKELGNAGSFFKNPVVPQDVADKLNSEYPDMPIYPDPDGKRVKLAAGWLIEAAGWKGKKMGRAGVHVSQALVLVNLGGATGAEILALSDAIVASVGEKFGVEISREVNIF